MSPDWETGWGWTFVFCAGLGDFLINIWPVSVGIIYERVSYQCVEGTESLFVEGCKELHIQKTSVACNISGNME
jgi:hypothetical protein